MEPLPRIGAFITVMTASGRITHEGVVHGIEKKKGRKRYRIKVGNHWTKANYYLVRSK